MIPEVQNDKLGVCCSRENGEKTKMAKLTTKLGN